MKAEDFLGLNKKDAQNKADRYNFIFRLIRIDEKAFFSYPPDTREDRVCVEIDNGEITKATLQ